MAEPFTSYSVDNDKRFRNALETASKEIVDFRIPFGQILRDFYRSEQSIFALKGPGKYPPFQNNSKKKVVTTKRAIIDTSKTPYQLKKLKRYGFDYPLLVATGKLASSLLGPTNPGSISFIGQTQLIFGTSVSYGIYHQSDLPRKKIPLRKFLFIGPEASRFASSDQIGRYERWIGYINDHVANVAIRNGIASKYQPKTDA